MHRSSRRSFLVGTSAILAGAMISGRRPRRAYADTPDKPAVVFVWLSGGHNALFGSADSFLTAGTFGVAAANVTEIGSGLYVDTGTFGTLPDVAKANMASIGCKHGISSHSAAKPALWNKDGHARHAVLAAALGGTAPIKCAAIGDMPPGPNLAEGSISVQPVADLAPILAVNGVQLKAPLATDASREMARRDLLAAQTMSKAALAAHPGSLRSLGDGYGAVTASLGTPALAIDQPAIAVAYGQPSTRTGFVSDFRSKMAGAEVLVRAGVNVVYVRGPGLDSHGDVDGVSERTRMGSIMTGLNTFLSRMMALPGYNVVTVVMSDFSRSLPGSDHQPNLTATVFGKRVKQGTTGRVDANVALPAGTAGIDGLWAYVAKAAGAATEPFGANPHALIV